MKFGVKLGWSLASVGFDGKFIDVSVDFVGWGYFFYFDKGKLIVKVDPIVTPGLTISIDFGAIIEEIIRFGDWRILHGKEKNLLFYFGNI